MTHITHPRTLSWTRASLACTDSETDLENPSRAAGFTGMVRICRITLPLDVQGFYLAFLSRNIPFSSPGGTNLNSLMDMTQNRNCRNKLAVRCPLWGWGEVFLDLNSFWANKKKAEFWVEMQMEVPESPEININKRNEHNLKGFQLSITATGFVD